jgi:hypothetical protein
MIFSKIKLFGLLALSYSLMACGQAPVSTAPNATSNAIAQPTVAAQPTANPVAVAKSPEPQPSAVASTKVKTELAQSQDSSTKTTVAQQTTDVDAEILYKTFEEIDQQPCDDRKTVTENGTKYSACTANAGGRGQYRFISASISLGKAGDGIGYWYYLNGKVAAIRFFHSGDLFVFDTNGKLQAELISAQKVIVNGEEQFQKRSAKSKFDNAERDNLEKIAKDGGKEILSKFK